MAEGYRRPGLKKRKEGEHTRIFRERVLLAKSLYKPPQSLVKRSTDFAGFVSPYIVDLSINAGPREPVPRAGNGIEIDVSVVDESFFGKKHGDEQTIEDDREHTLQCNR